MNWKDKAIELFEKGMSYRKITEELQKDITIGRRRITDYLQSEGYKRVSGMQEHEVCKAIELSRKGKDFGEIAIILNRDRKTISRRVKQRGISEEQLSEWRENNRILECSQCGVPFLKTEGYQQREYQKTYCSKACFEETRKKKCYCGKSFVVSEGEYTYCSDECRDRYNKALYKKTDSYKKQLKASRLKTMRQGFQPRALNCSVCGKRYLYHSLNRSELYCNIKCANKQHNRNGYYRRRMLEKTLKEEGNFDKSINLDLLYKKDGGICYICGEGCDWDDHVWEDGIFKIGSRYPTIDHVFPVSRGGSHTWDNIQLAHHSCNSIKRDKVIA